MPDHVYIDKAELNGKSYTRNYLKHEDIRKGGELIFDMSKEPNTKRGIGARDRPYSMSLLVIPDLKAINANHIPANGFWLFANYFNLNGIDALLQMEFSKSD
ncbi:MAG: hypothetical protein D4R64_16450 [Porphyromonadaceae bacterium]|nr:MAG: hypothetical protein D4R64_16450 [Porphyromonadaceae bacterium]